MLDGQNNGTVLYLNGGSEIEINGLTVQNGRGDENAGGVNSNCDNLIISSCIFSGNSSDNYLAAGVGGNFRNLEVENSLFYRNIGGAAVGVQSSGDNRVSQCQFIENHSNGFGGAIVIGYNDHVEIKDSYFEGNTARSGGAIYHYWGIPSIYNCTFIRNSAVYGGGAITGLSATGPIVNCIFAENTADYGGAIYNSLESALWFHPIITNCTFWNNHASSYGGAILNRERDLSEPRPLPFTNCILWENSAPLGPQIYNTFDSLATLPPVPIVTYCNIQGGYPGEGNTDTFPHFLAPEESDFHLKIDSPCINTGTLADAPNDDFEGDMRPQGTGIDVGADEYTFNIPDILDFFDRSVLEGSLVGYGPGNSADGRLNSLRKMLERANDWINQGEIEKSCNQLKIAFESCDGVDQKSEFAAGEAVAYLNYIINEIMVSVGCESRPTTTTPLYTRKLLNKVPTYHTDSPLR